MSNDRLTEIRARVTSKIEVCARHGAEPPSWASDLEYALGEIERLDAINSRLRLSWREDTAELATQRDRLRGLLKIAFSAWMRGPDGHIAQDDVNAISAALEESK